MPLPHYRQDREHSPGRQALPAVEVARSEEEDCIHRRSGQPQPPGGRGEELDRDQPERRQQIRGALPARGGVSGRDRNRRGAERALPRRFEARLPGGGELPRGEDAPPDPSGGCTRLREDKEDRALLVDGQDDPSHAGARRQSEVPSEGGAPDRLHLRQPRIPHHREEHQVRRGEEDRVRVHPEGRGDLAGRFQDRPVRRRASEALPGGCGATSLRSLFIRPGDDDA